MNSEHVQYDITEMVISDADESMGEEFWSTQYKVPDWYPISLRFTCILQFDDMKMGGEGVLTLNQNTWLQCYKNIIIIIIRI